MITIDKPRHTTANSKTLLTFMSGVFISIAIFFLLILSRLLRVDRQEMDSSAFHDKTTTQRRISPGSIYITAYEGSVAGLISGFTSSKWNHIALVGEDNLVHEILRDEIHTTDIDKWRTKWADKTIVLLERSEYPLFSINERVSDLREQGIRVSVNPLFLSGLLFGVDLDENTMYCTKFVRYVLDEDLPLIPSEYVSINNEVLSKSYYDPYPVRYVHA